MKILFTCQILPGTYSIEAPDKLVEAYLSCTSKADDVAQKLEATDRLQIFPRINREEASKVTENNMAIVFEANHKTDDLCNWIVKQVIDSVGCHQDSGVCIENSWDITLVKLDEILEEEVIPFEEALENLYLAENQQNTTVKDVIDLLSRCPPHLPINVNYVEFKNGRIKLGRKSG